MSLRQYLPSAQFAAIAISIALSVGLVFAADAVTRPKNPPAGEVSAVSDDAAMYQDEAQWKATLNNIQGSQTLGSLPPAPDETTVAGLLQGAQSSNITDSIGRSLLVKLTDAKAQGLGGDIPTQTQLINEAVKQLPLQQTKTYTTSDLALVQDSPQTQKAFGNAVMTVMLKYPEANVPNTYVIIGYVTDTKNAAPLEKLNAIETAYASLAKELAAIPVPKTLAPLYLPVVNNFTQIAKTYPDMETLISDPLRGLAGIQKFQSLTTGTVGVFTNIAQALNKNGILFGKDEPGAAWAMFLVSK